MKGSDRGISVQVRERTIQSEREKGNEIRSLPDEIQNKPVAHLVQPGLFPGKSVFVFERLAEGAHPWECSSRITYWILKHSQPMHQVCLCPGFPGGDAGTKAPFPSPGGDILGWMSFGQNVVCQTRISVCGRQDVGMDCIFLHWKSSSTWNA